MNTRILALIAAYSLIFTAKALADQEPELTLAEADARSVLVLEGIATKIDKLGSDIYAEQPTIKKIPYTATIKIDRLFKGNITDDEKAKGQIIVFYYQIPDKRYKGNRVPELVAGKRYHLSIENFVDLPIVGHIPILHTWNNIRQLD